MNMKKAFMIYGLAWVLFFASIVVCKSLQGSSTSDHHGSLMSLSENPSYLEEVLELDLPDVVDVKADKGIGSRWITYGFELKFSEGLSQECVSRLEELCRTDKRWSRYSVTTPFIYQVVKGDEYIISCVIYDDHSVVEYSLGDGEDAIFEPGFLIAFFSFHALLVWGFVLAVIAIVRRVRKQ